VIAPEKSPPRISPRAAALAGGMVGKNEKTTLRTVSKQQKGGAEWINEGRAAGRKT
jgi:hypothetical protein